MKYYFITYKWTRPNMDGRWNTDNAVTSSHPVEWLKDVIESYEDTYRIEFFSEISREHYDLIYGWVE